MAGELIALIVPSTVSISAQTFDVLSWSFIAPALPVCGDESAAADLRAK